MKVSLKVAVGALGGFHVIIRMLTGAGGANTLVASVPIGSPNCSMRSLSMPLSTSA